MRALLVCVMAAAAAAGGCTTHYGLVAPTTKLRFALVEDGSGRAEQLQQALSDKEIANLLDVDARPKLPTGIAVARILADDRGEHARLGEIDAEEMAGWRKTVEGDDRITAIRPVTHLTVPSGTLTLRNLRVAAAKMDCELLLAYLRADSSVQNRNYASILYWSVIGLSVVPGHRVEHKTVLQAALVDARTGMILATACGDSHLTRLCPWAFTDDHLARLRREAPDKALTELQQDVRKLLAKLATPVVMDDRRAVWDRARPPRRP